MRFFFSTMTCVFLTTFALHGIIQPVANLVEINQVFSGADEQTLGVFDIDNTLIQSSEPAFQPATIARFQNTWNEVLKNVQPQKIDVIKNLINIRTQAELLDQATPQFMRQLRQRQIAAIGLTKDFTGEFAGVPNMANWKIGQLEQLGVQFSFADLFNDVIIFTSLPPFRNNHPTYANGIIFTNGRAKADVLIKFLFDTGFHPQKVIYVDNVQEQLQAVAAALNQVDPNIEFIGLLFTGCSDMPSTQITEEQFRQAWQKVVDEAYNVQ